MTPDLLDRSPQRLIQLVQEGALSYNDLHNLNFSPYYPKGYTNYEDFSPASKENISIVSSFFQDRVGELTSRGLLAASIVGSTAVGLARQSRFSHTVDRHIDPKSQSIDMIKLQAGPVRPSDVDIQIVGSEKDKESLLSYLSEEAQAIKRPLFDFPFTTIERTHTDVFKLYRYSLVRFGIWQSEVPVFGEDLLMQIRESARTTLEHMLPSERNSALQLALDMVTYQKAKMKIKNGLAKEVMLTKEQLPVLFQYL